MNAQSKLCVLLLQIVDDKDGADCRIGTVESGPRPFAGISCNIDFCCHGHQEKEDLEGGASLVGENITKIN